jgi:hypothetical protein
VKEKIVRIVSWPIRRPIDRAAIAEQHAMAVICIVRIFEVFLHMVDCALRGFAHLAVTMARKATQIEQRCRFGYDNYSFADFSPVEISSGGFAAARPSGQYNPAAMVLHVPVWFSYSARKPNGAVPYADFLANSGS